jgi:hypothetical protein
MARRSSDVDETSCYRTRGALVNRRRDPAQPRGTLEAWDWRRSCFETVHRLTSARSEPVEKKGATSYGDVLPTARAA